MKSILLISFTTILTALLSLSSKAALSRIEFEQLKSALIKTFNGISTQKHDVLAINDGIDDPNFWWNYPVIQAIYVRSPLPEAIPPRVEHYITIMGGLLNFPKMSAEGLSVIACHELGHALLKAPYKQLGPYQEHPTALEGACDYFATNICLPRVLKNLKSMPNFKSSTFTPTAYEKKICKKQTKHSQTECQEMMFSIRSYTTVFKETTNEDSSIEEHSHHITPALVLDFDFYPSSQCRIDTFINGILNIKEPQCWNPSGTVNGALR